MNTVLAGRQPFPRLVVAALIVFTELVILSLVYKNNFDFTCRATAPAAFCAFAGRIVPRALGIVAVLGLFLLARRQFIGDLLNSPAPQPVVFILNALGFLIALIPWFFLSDASSLAMVGLGASLWVIAAVILSLTALVLVAPLTYWRHFLYPGGAILAAGLLAAVFAPELSDQLQRIWDIEWVTEATFYTSVWISETLFGYDLIVQPEHEIIGVAGFLLAVGPQCSGVEGFALITGFQMIYMALFRKELRFPHILILLPVGLVISWIFNAFRIAILLAIGIEISPELAIDGFHSHAGWLSFTLLSLGFIALSRTVPFFFKERKAAAPAPRAETVPLRQDRAAAALLPFAAFMFSALLASTFLQNPGVAYPLRAIILAAALAYFWPVLRALPWRFDYLSAAIGLVIAGLWIATGETGTDTPPPFGSLTGIALVFWMVTRLVSTGILVPVMEELLFRGYILERIARNGKWPMMVLAIMVSSVLFGGLHSRWLAGFLSGLAFSLLVWRSRNISDPIIAHMVANISIGLWALYASDWSII